jgi:hypothetical protein
MMPPKTDQSNLKALAETVNIDTLVDRVRRGLIRVPIFQRKLRWESKDVLALFDSVHRGYPVGSFLFSKRKADAKRINMGPLLIDAPETPSAYWVVDGQQRITALAVVLSRPVPIPTTPEDPWVVYFDAMTRSFHTPSRDGQIPASWIPAAQLLDAAALSEWVHNWTYAGNSSLRSAVFDAGARIRQYQIPLYTVETNDEQALKDIFYRINNYGKSLRWPEIHDALFGHGGQNPSTLNELAEELQELRMGKPEEEQLLSCLLAFKGLDVTRSLVEHYRRDQNVLKTAVVDALPTIRHVLSFLKIHAGIAHLRLLPHSTPLPVLTRFFALYPNPNSRTITLLSRWTWRTLLSKRFYAERTLLRRGVDVIEEGDEEMSVQALLALLPREKGSDFMLPERFDGRAAESRLAMIGLSSLNPRRIIDGKKIDVASLIEENDIAAFRKIISGKDSLARSPANRILLDGSGFARNEILDLASREGADSPILSSHAISPSAVAALETGDAVAFFNARKKSMETVVRNLADRFAGWDRSDHPSLFYLLHQPEVSN